MGESVRAAPRGRVWRRASALLALSAVPLAANCATDEGDSGQLILAVQADMKVPDDVDEVRIEILSYGSILFESSYVLGPGEDSIRIPATLAILAGQDPTAPVTVRVISRQGARLRTLRQVVTTVPEQRVATLRMPIQWLCDGAAVEAKPGEVDSTCPEGESCVSGRCVTDAVDSESLPDFAPEDVFGGGSGQGDGTCLDTVGCFAGGSGVQLDEACTFAAADTASLNVAMVLPPGGDGICGPEACLVPLDKDPDAGWYEEGGRVVLPPPICERLGDPILGVATTTSCPTKTPSVPTCGPWSAVTEQAATADAGAPKNVSSSTCGAPSSADRAALCITLEPEEIQLIGADPELDGSGTLVVEAYDTPDFEEAVPIATADLTGDYSVDSLPMVRLDDLPDVVYLFAALYDNESETDVTSLRRGGAWIGGIGTEAPDIRTLAPVPLQIGSGNSLTLPLTALRRLRVTMSLSPDAMVSDDGAGYAQWLAYPSVTNATDAPPSGVSERVCAELGVGPAVVEGFVIGPGPHHVVATLDDYGVGISTLAPPGSLPGSIVSGSPQGADVWEAANSVTFPGTQYTHSTLVSVGHVVPVTVVPKSFRCTSSECSDGAQNGAETDVDCGGSCAPCLDGRTCAGPSDCESRVCIANLCQVAKCTDGVHNGMETDVDCGGSCSPCTAGQGCLTNGDCAGGGLCTVNECVGGSPIADGGGAAMASDAMAF